MAKRRRKKSRRSNPAYSDGVYALAGRFIDAVDKASNEGYSIAKKIDIKAGSTKIGGMIEKAAERLRDISESLEDELGD